MQGLPVVVDCWTGACIGMPGTREYQEVQRVGSVYQSRGTSPSSQSAVTELYIALHTRTRTMSLTATEKEGVHNGWADLRADGKDAGVSAKENFLQIHRNLKAIQIHFL